MEKNYIKTHTKILTGKDALEQLCDECLTLGSKVLIIFSDNSIKQTGLYARVISLLNICGIEHITYEGINATDDDEYLKAIELAKNNDVQLILGIGNNQLTTFSNIVAHGFFTDSIKDLYNETSFSTQKCLPVINIMSATDGSKQILDYQKNENSIIKYYSEIKPTVIFTDFEY